MNNITTTALTSKGEIVIPISIRKELNLKTGVQFLVIGDEDVVILKKISKPSLDRFNELITKARKTAQESGLTKKDIKNALKKVRNKK